MKTILFLFFILINTLQAQETDPYRLSHNVEPEFQFIHLNLDPDKENYSGYTELTLNVNKEVSEFRLHGKDFKITKFDLMQNGKPISAEYEFQEYGLVKIKAGQSLSNGAYKARFEFEGTISRKGEGICWFEKDSINYLYTQMEAINARQFFPCFDEPNFKIPFQIEITAPEEDLVVSNTPEEKVSSSGLTKTYLFKKTKPIPSYLVAFAVGPYESIDIPGLSVPGRIIVPKGYIQKSQYGKSITAQILNSLEEYFDIPYPYEKLDFIAVANYYGAMENPGLIVYREGYLIDPPNQSLVEKYGVASLIAHEVAHMWFGNLVTLEWWDDTWLKEGFSSWIAEEIMVKNFPDLKPLDVMVRRFNSALNTDRTENTTAIARTIKGSDNPYDAFDALSYSKSQVVLRMLEKWIGEENFQKGLRDYLNLYKWKNATSSDLIETVSKASDKNVSKILNDFIKQPGVPIVSVQVEGNKIKLIQTRLKTADVKKDFKEEWLIPLNLKINDGKKTQLKKIVLDKKEQEFVFNDIDKIEWIHLKDNFAGYFIINLPRQVIKKAIISGELNDAEIMDIFIGLKYGFQSGKINPADILDLISEFDETKNISLASALATIFSNIRWIYGEKIGSDLFNSYTDQTAIPLLNTIGTRADLSHTVSERNAQSYLINSLQKNSTVVEEVAQLGQTYLDNETLSSWSYSPFLETLCYNYPNDTLYDNLKNRALSTTVASEKNLLLNAISSFPGKYVYKTLDMVLNADLEPNDRFWIPINISWAAFREKFLTGKKSDTNIIKWIKENETFYLETVSEDYFSYLPRIIKDLEDLNTFENLFPEETRSKSMQIQFEKKKSDIMRTAKLQELYLEDVKQYLTNFNNAIGAEN